MSIKRPRFDSRTAALVAAGALALGGAAWATLPSGGAGPRPLPPEFEAAYPAATSVAPSAGSAIAGTTSGATFAGVDLSRFGAAMQRSGLHESARDAYTPDEGGLVLSFADVAGDVRAVVKIAVADDAAGARRFVTGELLGISFGLPAAVDPALGDVAYADGGGRGDAFVVAAHANVGYAVRLVPDDNGRLTSSGASLAAALAAALVPGTPAALGGSLGLPAEMATAEGAPVRIAFPAGMTPQLAAEGAYVAHGPAGPVVRPFAPGPVSVTATLVDDLGRVSTARASSLAR